MMEEISESGSEGKDVVLVTGAAGCLGQHVVKMLQEHSTQVKEIRALDIKPYTNKLGHSEVTPMRKIVGDIRNREALERAFEGVDCVIHTASLINVQMFPDHKALEEINVKGTENVIEACISKHVKCLIYTSTMDVVIGFNDIINGDEGLSYLPKNEIIMPGYAGTKQEAEKLVLAANKRSLETGDDEFLRTIAIRPCSIYGEEDASYLKVALETAKNCGGMLPNVGHSSALKQQAYAGNIAWAHVLAYEKLRDNPKVGGKAYFITDDTPRVNMMDFVEKFLHTRGYRRVGIYIPFWVIYLVFVVLEFVLGLLRPMVEINPRVSWHGFLFSYRSFTFRRTRAEKMLGYKPIFDFEQGMENSMKYYSTVEL